MRYLLFLLILISLGSLPAQEYQVELRLTASSNFYQNLHPNADYQLYGYEPELLKQLIFLHGKGEIEVYADLPERRIISPDSFSFFFDIPDYTLLDSLVDVEEIYFAKAYKAMFSYSYINDFEYETIGDDDSLVIVIDTTLFEIIDTTASTWGFNAGEEFDPKTGDPIFLIPIIDSTQRDSMTGREQIRLFVEYDVYLEERWEVKAGGFEITADWIRIDLVDRNGKMHDPYSPIMPEADENDQTEFPFNLVKSSLYISAKDWIKLKPEWIFEKKWTARKGKTIPGLIKDRNFPAVLSTISPKNDTTALFINRRKGYQWKDSLFKTISYQEFTQNRVQRSNPTNIDTLEDFKIELRDDTLGLNYSISKEELALIEKTKAFLSSQTYKEVLSLAFSDKIQRQYSGYRSLDKSSQKECDCNYTSSLFLKGELVRMNEKVSFSPREITVIISEKYPDYFRRKQVFSLSLQEIAKYGLTFHGESLTTYLASMDYFFFPLSINKSQIHSYEKSFQIKELLFNGKWEEIKQSNKYIFGCDWNAGIDPNLR